MKTLFNYIGGKSWLSKKLSSLIDNKLENNKDIVKYVEPFAGGLGAFLNIYIILQKHNIKNVVLNDINVNLINIYQCVLNKPSELYDAFLMIEDIFRKCIPVETYGLNKTKDKEKIKVLLQEANAYYKMIRKQFNDNLNYQNINNANYSIQQAALLLFLQSHCFNGVYRENSKGEYNTPFNWDYAKNKDLQNRIKNIHDVFNNFKIEFYNKSYEDLKYSKDTLLYLDPPYINEDVVENQYNKTGFSIIDQKKLIQCIQPSHYIYSNHYNDALIKEFQRFNSNVEIIKINRKNIISASVESRKTDKVEMLIMN